MSFDNNFDIDEMQEIISDFLAEADEITSSLNQNFIKLESHPTDSDLLNEIFRAVHTIKGAAGFLNLEEVSSLSHKMEDILNKLRKEELSITMEIMDVLLNSLDVLKKLIDNVRDNKHQKPDISDILNQMNILLFEETPITDKISNKSKQTVDDKITESKEEKTIRISVDKLDKLLNMMGELVLSRNSIVQTVTDLTIDNDGNPKFDQLSEVTNSINFITTELQMTVMKMRMQPVSKLFNKIPRLVRDLARDESKKIELRITGKDTEVDKAIIEHIADPLVHIIRNACNHGIESPKKRKEQNKPEKGIIHLSASQEGSNIVIRVKDNGRGLDLESIRKKVIESNKVSKLDIENLSDQQLFQFIFEPGFTTAKKVSDVSGRGVGMDVVHTNIEKLNGSIDINSANGKGTTFTIKLPLTLAIIQGLLVESDNEVYVLPMSAVVETVRLKNDDIYYVNKKPVFRVRDEVIPVININGILKGSDKGFVIIEKPYIVVVSLGSKKLGIMIDKFIGQEEVVVKPLGKYMNKTEGVAGATILGTGHVRLIIDLIGLFNLTRKLV
jgi:two-component system chemotaxis sensor kinase CheA